MSGFINILEVKLIPVAAWIERNKFINGFRRSFIILMPLLMIGSIFLMIEALPIPGYKAWMTSMFGDTWIKVLDIPIIMTFSLIAIYVSFLVAQQLAKQYGVDDISVGLLSLASFLILTPLKNIDKIGDVITFAWLGSKGMFIAMVVAICTFYIFRFFVNRKIIIKMPDGVPPEVVRSFEALIPGTVIITLALALRVFFMHTEYGTIHNFLYTMLAIPLRAVGTSYLGSMFATFAIQILWSVGINSGSMVNGFVRPFWLENQAENIAAFQAGHALPHVITEQFFDMVYMGGAGATLSLIIAIFLFARSKHVRGVASIGLLPGIFNINEPILFGIPVILNPIMLIPFNLVPLVFVTTQYIAMSTGLVASPLGVAFPWPTPAIISGFIAVGGISGSIMQIFNLILGALIYLPFIKIVDKAKHLEEKN